MVARLPRRGSPSGGGFGDPLERAPDAVLRDVLDELLSPDLAKLAYGVVIANGCVDLAATRVERARLAASSRSLAAFAFGPEREAHEARWSNPASAALANSVLAAPAGLRPYLLTATKQRLALLPAAITAHSVEQAVRDLLIPLQENAAA